MATLKLNTNKKHEISPYLYMQFMEPLGVADTSVDAAWDFIENDWYPCVIDKVKELKPTMVRFGGCFASYYHWKEAIGPQNERIPMLNHCWGGKYFNQVGTHEFLDFCKRVNAEPLIVVNMESEGLKFWQYPKNDTVRLGTAEEAAEWVAYCNDPDNGLRKLKGQSEPYKVKYWQIGNETSYKPMGNIGFSAEQCYDTTCRFAEKMRKADESIKLIGWGDAAPGDDRWCEKMSRADGIDMLAFHHHIGDYTPESPIYSLNYRKDFHATWDRLMSCISSMETHIGKMREQCGSKRLAMTEGHFATPGRNRNELLSTWAVGVTYARWHNIIMRNSDVLDIATLADFLGNVWQCNAIMVPTPMRKDSKCYLQPVGHVMRLFGEHQGKNEIDISYDGNVDAVASITDKTVYIHIASTSMTEPETLTFDLGGKEIESMAMYCISADPQTEITPQNTDCFKETVTKICGNTVTLPAASVAAIEIKVK